VALVIKSEKSPAEHSWFYKEKGSSCFHQSLKFLRARGANINKPNRIAVNVLGSVLNYHGTEIINLTELNNRLNESEKKVLVPMTETQFRDLMRDTNSKMIDATGEVLSWSDPDGRKRFH